MGIHGMRTSGTKARTNAQLGDDGQENLARLAALGVTVNDDGSISSDAFEGDGFIGEEPGDGTEVDEPTPARPAVDRIEVEDDVVADLPGDEPAERTDHAAPRKPGEQTEEGLAKREADARKAQSELSKTQVKVNAQMAALDKRISDLDDKIQQYAVLQATAGSLPTNLNPADEETVSQYREDYPEAVGVMESIAAPLYGEISRLREQLNAVVKKQGEYFSDLRTKEVFGAIYAKIPNATEIAESPEFHAWLGNIRSDRKRALYADIISNTTNYTTEDALEVFEEYAQATGTNLGTPKPVHHTEMDRSPAMRSGSALPEAPAPRRNNPSNALTPFSMEELSHFGELIREAQTPQERDILNKRLLLSQSDLELSGAHPREYR
jgi:hypothetical protein